MRAREAPIVSSKAFRNTNSIHLSRRSPRTATPSTVREVNRAITLNLIRTHEPISRARLSQLTGISPSNISDIVQQLLDQRLVIEERAEPCGRGRVPFQLRLNSSGFHVIAVSIRSIETTVALAGLTGEFQTRIAFPTPDRPPVIVDRIAHEVQDLRSNKRLRLSPNSAVIAVSAPGLVHSQTGSIRWLPSLPQYSNFHISEAVEARTGIPCVSENDCNLGALAELSFADAELNHLTDFVFLEIGDVGVGGSIIINRTVYGGYDFTVSAEFGHMVVDPSGPRCSCGRCGCWELYVCDRATWNRYCPDMEYSSQRFDEFLRSLSSGEPAATAAIEQTARYLSEGIANIAFALNPQTIIVAGRLTEVWRFLEPVILSELDGTKLGVTVRTARHSAEELFLYGAARLALNHVFAQPKVGW